MPLPTPLPENLTHPWFAIRVRSNYERVLSSYLESRDFHQYLPLYRDRRQWSDRVREIDLPLFAGYVFCRLDPERTSQVLGAPGVVNIVGYGAMTEDISADTRAQIWSDSVGIVKAFPLFGVGLGGYESALYRFKTVAPMHTVDYAHNDYLQVLVEMGVVGFALGLVLLLMVLWSAFRGAFYARDNDHRLLQIGVLGGLTAIALHSFVDFNMYVPANALVVAWISGIASAHLTRPPKRQLEPA